METLSSPSFSLMDFPLLEAIHKAKPPSNPSSAFLAAPARVGAGAEWAPCACCPCSSPCLSTPVPQPSSSGMFPAACRMLLGVLSQPTHRACQVGGSPQGSKAPVKYLRKWQIKKGIKTEIKVLSWGYFTYTFFSCYPPGQGCVITFTGMGIYEPCSFWAERNWWRSKLGQI